MPDPGSIPPNCIAADGTPNQVQFRLAGDPRPLEGIEQIAQTLPLSDLAHKGDSESVIAGTSRGLEQLKVDSQGDLNELLGGDPGGEKTLPMEAAVHEDAIRQLDLSFDPESQVFRQGIELQGVGELWLEGGLLGEQRGPVSMVRNRVLKQRGYPAFPSTLEGPRTAPPRSDHRVSPSRHQ